MTQLINRGVLAVVFGTLLAAGSSPAKDVPLADKVRHELNMLPYYGVFDAISYEVTGNTVTLSGRCRGRGEEHPRGRQRVKSD
jgi:hypothetical protein